MNNLKICPFCGSDALGNLYSAAHGGSVMCIDCGAHGPAFDRLGEKLSREIEDGFDAWDCRPAELEQPASILRELELLPAGSYLDITRTEVGAWLVEYAPSRLEPARAHWGSTLTDALGQLTTVLALDAEPERG